MRLKKLIFFRKTFYNLQRLNVDGAQFVRVFGIRFRFVGNFLPFFQASVSIGLDCGVMHEYVVAAFIAGDKPVTFLRIEPFHRTLTHP